MIIASRIEKIYTPKTCTKFRKLLPGRLIRGRPGHSHTQLPQHFLFTHGMQWCGGKIQRVTQPLDLLSPGGSRTLSGFSVDWIRTVDTATNTIHGELVFASSNDLYTQFEDALDPGRVVIDMKEPHLWDVSTIAALESITAKYAAASKTAQITGLNEASAAMRQRMAGHVG